MARPTFAGDKSLDVDLSLDSKIRLKNIRYIFWLYMFLVKKGGGGGGALQ